MMNAKIYGRAVLFVLGIFFIGLTSCEDHDNNEEDESYINALLCDKVWTDYFDVDKYTECRRELTFSRRGTGTNYRRYFDIGNGEYLGDERDSFYWKWTDWHQNAIIMEYSDGISRFDDIWIQKNYLYGILDGYNVTFSDKMN